MVPFSTPKVPSGPLLSILTPFLTLGNKWTDFGPYTFPFPEYTRNGIIQYARAFGAWYLLSVTLWGLNLVICIAVWCSVVWCTTAAYLFTRGWTCEWFPVWGFMKKSDIDIYILIFVSLWCFDLKKNFFFSNITAFQVVKHQCSCRSRQYRRSPEPKRRL